jgi:lysophospholipase L1-like esterase
MNKIILIVIFLLITILTILKESDEVKYTALDKDMTILAFGDSLTYGFGANEDESYPSVMQRKTSFHIINAGVNGETTAESLYRLPLYLEHQPEFVILCIGGNDILQNVPKKIIKQNIKEMVEMIKQSGADMMLVGVPELNTFGFRVLDIYEEIAQEYDILYEDDILSYIELRRELKSDYIHPNARGYEMMADAFIKVLKDKGVIK